MSRAFANLLPQVYMRLAPYVVLPGVLLVGTLATEAPAGDAGEISLEGIADACEVNRMAFSDVVCRFRLTQGLAPTIEQALSKGVTTKMHVAKGVWACRADGDVVRHSLSAASTESELRGRISVGPGGIRRAKATSPYLMAEAIWCDDIGLRYLQEGGIANLLDSAQGMSADITVTPFDMIGMMGGDEILNPTALIRGSQNDTEQECVVVGPELIRGVEAVKVSHRRRGSDGIDTFSDYWFAPGFGYLPVRLEYSYSRKDFPVTSVYVTDVRKAAGSGWAPWRTVKITSAGAVVKGVAELVVEDLRADEPPDVSVLVLMLPEGARINDSVDPRSQTRSPDGGWSIASRDDLRRVRGALNMKIVEREQNRRPTGQELSAESSVTTRVVLVVLNVVIAVTLLLWRARRRRNATG